MHASEEETGFLQAIVADPSTDGWLVYADWLEEHGDARADFVRRQAESLHLPADDQRTQVLSRLHEERRQLDPEWLVWIDLALAGHVHLAGQDCRRLAPLNGPTMRMPRSAWWASCSHDGRWIYTTGQDQHVWVWDAERFILRNRFPTGLESLVGSTLHPTKDWLAAGSGDGSVRIWELALGREILCAERHKGAVSAVRFQEDGPLASAGADGTVRLTDPASGKRAGRLKRLGSAIHGLAGTRTGSRLGAVYFRGVRVWDGDQTDVFHHEGLYYHGGEGQSALALPGRGDRLWVTFRREPYLRVWNLGEGRTDPVKTANLSGPAFSLAFSPDEQWLAVGLYRSIVLLRADTCEVRATWPAPNGVERYQGAVGGLAFSPDGGRLLSTDVAGGIWVWPVPV